MNTKQLEATPRSRTQTKILGAVTMIVFNMVLSACDRSSSSTPAAAIAEPTPVAGDKAMTYTDGDGIPEITATPTISPTTARADGRVSITVPVDSDTSAAEIYLKYPDSESTTLGRKPIDLVLAVDGVVSVKIDLVPFTTGGVIQVHVSTYTAAHNTAPYIYYSPNETYYRQNNNCPSCDFNGDTEVLAPTVIVSTTTKH